MGFAAASAQSLRPTVSLAAYLGNIALNDSISSRIGEWRETDDNVGTFVNPQQLEVLQKIYTEILSRTYADAEDYRIMLSIAYGADQGRALNLHYPDICYPSAGFEVLSKAVGLLQTAFGKLEVLRLITAQGSSRPEPLTYWVMTGMQQVLSPTSKRMAELSYTLRGYIPDGLIFRISSIDRNAEHAFAKQDAFAAALLSSVAPQIRKRLAEF